MVFALKVSDDKTQRKVVRIDLLIEYECCQNLIEMYASFIILFYSIPGVKSLITLLKVTISGSARKN